MNAVLEQYRERSRAGINRDAIPLELRELPHWICWRYTMEDGEEKPDKTPLSPVRLTPCGTTEAWRGSWAAFETAWRSFEAGQCDGVGLVVTADDPYVFVDFDDLSESSLEAIRSLNTYTESSISGRGLHCILRGSIPGPKKRNPVEIYSHSRYFIFTGRSATGQIEDRQEEITALWHSLPDPLVPEHRDSEAQEMSDTEALALLMRRQSFQVLFSTKTEGPGHSEEDLSFFCEMAYVTRNRDQMLRIAMLSERVREKWRKRPDYLERTAQRAIDTYIPLVETSGLLKLSKSLKDAGFRLAPKTKRTKDCPLEYAVEFPPGQLGQIAQFIYDTAPYKSREVAIGGALALSAGIFGRSHTIHGGGLNMFVVLLAPPSIGKNSAGKAVSRLLREAKAEHFIGLDQNSSPEGFIDSLAEPGGRSRVSWFGEVGKLLKRLCSDKAASQEHKMMSFLLRAFDLTDIGAVFEKQGYKDKTKVREPILRPSFSFIGDTTFSGFRRAHTLAEADSGWLSRLTTIPVRHPKSDFHEDAWATPTPKRVLRAVGEATAAATKLNGEDRYLTVAYGPEAKDILSRFEQEMTERHRATEDESVQAQVGRGHYQALRIAGNLAAMDNPTKPVITEEMATWSVGFARFVINWMAEDIETGMLGEDTARAQMSELKRLLRSYLDLSWNKLPSTWQAKLDKEAVDYGVVQNIWLARQLSASRRFAGGSAQAAKDRKAVISAAEECGLLTPLKTVKFTGVAWLIDESQC